MAGKPGRKPAAQQAQPKPFDEFAEDGEVGAEEELPVVDTKGKPKVMPSGVKLRDWRDVERFREERNLKKLVGDDIDELFSDKPRR